MKIIAIPVHDAKSRIYQSEDTAAKIFHTTGVNILRHVENGSVYIVDSKHRWFFDEAISNGERRTFKCVETGEEVSVYGAKEFCEWSGYKSDDILTKGSGRVVNRNDGKTYELVN